MTRFIYLHGLASSPQSKKASAFREVFDRRGWPLDVPDLENGDFENLTISGQMEIVKSIIDTYPGETFGLIGSSLGGYLAALTGECRREVAAVYLMAPAFGFLRRWKEKMRQTCGVGQLPELIDVFHFRYNEDRLLNTGIFQDAERWETMVFKREFPIRIVHGVHDDSVPVSESEKFSRNRSHVRFSGLDSDHGLLSRLDWIIKDCVDFFRKEGLV